jgi:hypothetical protein
MHLQGQGDMSKQLYVAYPELKDLDKYARTIAERLFKLQPQWLNYMRIDPAGNALVVELPPPVEAARGGMTIRTREREVLVQFDQHQMRLASSGAADQDFEAAIAFIDGLLCEDIVVGVKVADGALQASRSYRASDIAAILPGDVTYTRSWLGTYNRSYE